MRNEPSATARRTSPTGPASYSAMTGAESTAVLKPVGVAPGSTMVTPMPKGATSAARVSQKPSTPHFAAW